MEFAQVLNTLVSLKKFTVSRIALCDFALMHIGNWDSRLQARLSFLFLLCLDQGQGSHWLMVVGGGNKGRVKGKGWDTMLSHFLSALSTKFGVFLWKFRNLRLIDNSWFSDGGTNRHVKELTRKHPAVYRFFRLRLLASFITFCPTIILTYGYFPLNPLCKAVRFLF